MADALNARHENAGLENVAPDLTGRKMQEWKMQGQYARAENARLENAGNDIVWKTVY